MGRCILAEQAWLISQRGVASYATRKEKQKALSENEKAMKRCTTTLTRAGLGHAQGCLYY